MSDLYKRISRTDFVLGIISCAAVLFASKSLCTDCGNKYLMIFAIVINSVCGTINFQQSIRYKKHSPTSQSLISPSNSESKNIYSIFKIL